MAKEIPLSRNRVTIVDDEDFEWLCQYKWSYATVGYAVKRLPPINGKQRLLLMHRAIMKALPGWEIDHINRDKLDNRKENLRVCLRHENQCNLPKYTYKRFSSRFKGVTWDKRKAKWMSQLHFHKKHIFLGYFDSEIEAALAYNHAAKQLFGEFACLNEIPTFKNTWRGLCWPTEGCTEGGGKAGCLYP